MEESSTYQAILAKGKIMGVAEGVVQGISKGKVEEAREDLLLIGSELLGAPAPDNTAAIEAISDLKQLKELMRRALQVSSWEELFGEAKPKRRNGKAKKKS
jgi:hypothetical protein